MPRSTYIVVQNTRAPSVAAGHRIVCEMTLLEGDERYGSDGWDIVSSSLTIAAEQGSNGDIEVCLTTVAKVYDPRC